MMNRRQFLAGVGGGMALTTLPGFGLEEPQLGLTRHAPHFVPRVRRVIHLVMNGGAHAGDTFDPKPLLKKYEGQTPESVVLRTERPTKGLMPSAFEFKHCGQSGIPICTALPRFSEHADDLCVIRSMHTSTPNHGASLFMMNNGSITPNRPSMGTWMNYALGSDNKDLPGFIVLCPGLPVRGEALWGSGFMPGELKGLKINIKDKDLIPYLNNHSRSNSEVDQYHELSTRLNKLFADQHQGEPDYVSKMQSQAVAYRMQFAANVAFDIGKEPQHLQEMYGPSNFAKNCLLARRLVERGVRFVQVYYGDGQPWDTHANHNKSSMNLVRSIDQPMAALLSDLKWRGMLEDTLVIWGGEFGRTPTTEGSSGRDHNHYGFTWVLAGGGVKGGYIYGATDEFGFKAVENRMHIHDFHATLLHLMGFDHERLTYRSAGRDYRLTDVHGHVAKGIIA